MCDFGMWEYKHRDTWVEFRRQLKELIISFHHISLELSFYSVEQGHQI